MMHNMHDLQCLNACITPEYYNWGSGAEEEGRGRGRWGKKKGGGGGARVRVRDRCGGRWDFLCLFIYFFCACIYFFCAFLKNRQNKLYFSVSVDFFRVCIVTHRKISLWVLVFFCRDILEPTEKS